MHGKVIPGDFFSGKWQEAYDELMDLMSTMEIVDSHEHLPPEAHRVSRKLDFSIFFSCYCRDDLLSSGMPASAANKLFDDNTPLEEKWRTFEPYYRLIEDGSYCRAAHLSMEKFYGIPRLALLEDAEALSLSIQKANKPGLYRKVLEETCGMHRVISYEPWMPDDPNFFARVMFATSYAEATPAVIRDLEDRLGRSCASLEEYVEAVREEFRLFKAQGLNGIKFHFAYTRDLHFSPRTYAEAEQVFHKALEHGYGRRHSSLGYEEYRPLQDYMVHRLIEMAGEMDMPVVFHTGLQAETHHNAEDSRPTPLWNLPNRYRHVDFVLLHAGIPWLYDAALLAKHYPNVYLAWLGTISCRPSYQYGRSEPGSTCCR